MSRLEATLQDFDLLDRVARGDTWVHGIDPRAKTIVTFVFVLLVASFPRHAVVELLPLFAYPAVLLIAAHLPLRIFVRPLVLALILAVFIGLANPLLDREPVRIGDEWQIAAGWLSLASLALRTTLCVTAVVALVATTGMSRLSHGLARLGVPRALVTQLQFLYRYVFLLADGAHTMLRARQLRSVGQPLGLATYAPLVGHLLLHTMDRADRIHRAMCCRGFHGDVPIGGRWRLRWTDLVFCVVWFAILLWLRWLPFTEPLGRWLLGRLS
ncbi:MAG: cobalt ECF transporter T component CbiQ [Planctomycetes bacterium]|nr:cobalt ECF transporter T component CbiQ [Planctomycetota bacterium]